jgi:hypothetical protein
VCQGSVCQGSARSCFALKGSNHMYIESIDRLRNSTGNGATGCRPQHKQHAQLPTSLFHFCPARHHHEASIINPGPAVRLADAASRQQPTRAVAAMAPVWVEVGLLLCWL